MPKLVKKHPGTEHVDQIQSTGGTNDLPMPHLVDTQGRLLDPRSALNMPKVLADGQASSDSIFHVPSETLGSSQELTLNAIIEQCRRQGFGGENVIVHMPVRPNEQEEYYRKREEAKQYHPHGDKNYRRAADQSVSCPYCKAILDNEEDSRGFDLDELHVVAKSGCETCDIIQQAVTYFADLIYMKYDMTRVFVKQRQNEPDRLLAQTRTVEVRFEEHHDETLALTFSEVGKPWILFYNIDKLSNLVLDQPIER